MKVRHIPTILAFAILLPLATLAGQASALTANDIQQQIQSLLAQVAQLQEQLKQLQTPAPVVPPTSSTCPILNRALSRGASGSDVASLQAYLGVSQTGYFGPLTESAVQQFQAQEGIVSSGNAATTGYGAVGARTRAALAWRCGNPSPQPQPPIACTAVHPICGSGYHVGGYCNNQCIPDTTSLGAPTISGLDAPTTLSVGQQGTWTVHASVPGGGQVSYSVVWGDENYLPTLMNAASAVAVNTSGSFTHTYSSAGTYSPIFTVSNSYGSAKTSASVVVSSGINCLAVEYQIPICPAGQHVEKRTNNGCPAPPACVPDGTSSFSASPQSGAAPLAVTFAGSAPAIPDNSSFCPWNGAIVDGGLDYQIDYGDGREPSLPMATAFCGGAFSLSHRYSSPGTYTAKLNKVQFAMGATLSTQTIGIATITVGASASGSCTMNGKTYANGQLTYYYGYPDGTFSCGCEEGQSCDASKRCSNPDIPPPPSSSFAGTYAVCQNGEWAAPTETNLPNPPAGMCWERIWCKGYPPPGPIPYMLLRCADIDITRAQCGMVP